MYYIRCMEIKTEKEKLAEKRLENLILFQKGVSGNPAGRKKGSKNKATILREMIQAKGCGGSDPFNYYVAKYLELAEKEGTKAETVIQVLENLFNRVYGRPTSRVEHGRTQEDLAMAGAMVLATLKGQKIDTKDALGDIEDAEIIEED